MKYLEYLPDTSVYIISRYLAYVEVFMNLKYTNKMIKYNIERNNKINRRKNMLYLNILKQQLYRITNNEKTRPFTCNQQITYIIYCDKLCKYINDKYMTEKEKHKKKWIMNEVKELEKERNNKGYV